jgi:F-type H+-transporting ATPase subunit alpha
MIYTAVNGYLDNIPVEKIAAFEVEFLRFMDTSYPELGKQIAETKELGKDVEDKLKTAIQQFKQIFK